NTKPKLRSRKAKFSCFGLKYSRAPWMKEENSVPACLQVSGQVLSNRGDASGFLIPRKDQQRVELFTSSTLATHLYPLVDRAKLPILFATIVLKLRTWITIERGRPILANLPDPFQKFSRYATRYASKSVRISCLASAEIAFDSATNSAATSSVDSV